MWKYTLGVKNPSLQKKRKITDKEKRERYREYREYDEKKRARFYQSLWENEFKLLKFQPENCDDGKPGIEGCMLP